MIIAVIILSIVLLVSNLFWMFILVCVSVGFREIEKKYLKNIEKINNEFEGLKEIIEKVTKTELTYEDIKRFDPDITNE